ncbi:MAG: peptidoglycan DD-metalloendopeptidase family protein, partial [Candidatus Binatia bacterium]|nr:peptidoglycan DD-metalloendopeptidase family protein [Candidatus Binatia bacterium]
YSILILSRRSTRVRRLVLSQSSILNFLFLGAALLSFSGWMLGDYFIMKQRREEIQYLRVRSDEEAISLRSHHERELRGIQTRHGVEMVALKTQLEEQREKLLSLREQVESSRQLLANWKDLRQKVRASLPRKQKSLLSGQDLVDELQNGISSLHGDLEDLIASIPSKWPTNGWISSRFGNRKSPWTGKKKFHSGIDIANHRDTPVYAPGDGVVQYAGRNGGSGKNIVLNHGQSITTHYGHLSKLLVKMGDRVHKEQQIVKVGNTGKSTNPHLHYEIRVGGAPINPRRKLLKQNPPPS